MICREMLIHPPQKIKILAVTVAWKQLSGTGNAAAWLQRDNYRISPSKKTLMKKKVPCCLDGSSSEGRCHTEERKSHYSGHWGCLKVQ